MLTLYYEWLHGGTRNWVSWLLRQDVLRVSVFTQKLHATCNYVRMNFMSNTKYDLKYWISSCRVRMFQTIYKYINICHWKKNLNSFWLRLYFERGYFDPFKTFNYLDEIYHILKQRYLVLNQGLLLQLVLGRTFSVYHVPPKVYVHVVY